MAHKFFDFLKADKDNYPFTFSQLQADLGTVPKMVAASNNALLAHERVAQMANTLSIFFSVKKFGFLDLMQNMGSLSTSSNNVSVMISDDKFVDQLTNETSNDNRGDKTRVA